MIIVIGAVGIALVGVVSLSGQRGRRIREMEKLDNYRRAEALQKARGKYMTLEYYPRGI
mgnify:CR=1 FL=1